MVVENKKVSEHHGAHCHCALAIHIIERLLFWWIVASPFPSYWRESEKSVQTPRRDDLKELIDK